MSMATLFVVVMVASKRKPLAKDIHVLIYYGYVRLLGKGGICLQMELRLLVK